ncbi:MAG TPA: LysR family transcriptional regulator [Polyangiaceae bacterium]|nr:LysR family transcriptional regulator [Polyangiaceae bacterium]
MNTIHDTGAPAELSGVDLNLVVLFDAVAREGNVTRAAERLGVTQSALSHALRRLRTLVGDPLFVRGSGGMVLTPRAESLVVPLRSALVTLGRALSEPGVFAPGSARRAFRVATPDLFDVIVLPPVLERIRSEAPGIDVTIVPLDQPRLAERLETGEVDVAIVPREETQSSEAPVPAEGGLVRRTLFRDRLVCLIRGEHPLLVGTPGRRSRKKRSLSLDEYARLSHLLVSPSGQGQGPVDRALAERGLARRVALRVPHFYSALAIVARSDLVLTAPTALARVARKPKVVTLAPPLRLPGHSINLVWHERFSKDPAHAWLRELLVDVARETQQ